MIVKYEVKNRILVLDFYNHEIYFDGSVKRIDEGSNKKDKAEIRWKLIKALVDSKKPLKTEELYGRVYDDIYSTLEDANGQKLRKRIEEAKKYFLEYYQIPDFITHSGGYEINREYRLLEVNKDINLKSKYPLPKCFIEPVDYTKKLNRLINETYFNDEKKIFSVYGKSGMGKTEFIKYFLNQGLNKDYGLVRINKRPLDGVIYVNYQGSLKATISSLVTDPNNYVDPYEKAMETLKHLKESYLLVINRYNNLDYSNEINDLEDVDYENRAYNDLLGLDLTVVIVSTVDLSNVNSIRQIDFNGYSINELADFFLDKASDYPRLMKAKADLNFNKELKSFISKQLGLNTFLVTLSSELLKKEEFEVIKNAFKDLKVGEITESISHNSDGKPLEDTFMGHFDKAFKESLNYDDPKEVSMMKKVLFNLALLPLDGISDKLFYELAFTKDEEKEMKKALSILEGTSLIFWNTRISKLVNDMPVDSENMIGLSPIVKELISRYYLKEAYQDVSHFISEINSQKRAGANRYVEHFREYAKTAYSASISLELANIFDFEYVKLKVNAAQCYDILKEYDVASKIGKEALVLLDKVEGVDNLDLAYQYLRASNAIQHYYRDDSAILSLLAYGRGFRKAEELLEGRSDYNSRKLLTQIHGDINAIYLKPLSDFKNADILYEKMLEERLNIYEEYMDSSSLWLLAYAYKGLGTSKFYMSTLEKKKDYLTQSINSHWLSLQVFDMYYRVSGEDKRFSQEYMTELNRFVSTSLLFLENEFLDSSFVLKYDERFNDNKGVNSLRLNRDKYIALLKDYIIDTLHYFKTINPINYEQNIAKKNDMRLKELLMDIKR